MVPLNHRNIPGIVKRSRKLFDPLDHLLLIKMRDAQALSTAPLLTAINFAYLFGKATGSSHTLDRTNQLALEMKRLGVADNLNGHAILAEHFTQAAK